MKMDTAITRFFANMPEAMPLYEVVKNNILDSMENVSIKVQKSQISFFSNKSFAYVWLPILKIKNRPDVYIILTFGLGYQIQNPRIVESVEPYPNRWTHHVIINRVAEIDDEVMDWLRKAYFLHKDNAFSYV